jgi:hypothetical protein
MRARRRQEIMEMDMDKMEEEIKRTEEAIDDNLQRRAEWAGIIAAAGQDAPPRKKATLEAFTAYCMTVQTGAT